MCAVIVNGFELHRCSFPSNEYNEIYVSHFENFPLMVYLYVAHDYQGLKRKMVKYKNMLQKNSFQTAPFAWALYEYKLVSFLTYVSDSQSLEHGDKVFIVSILREIRFFLFTVMPYKESW